jgi:hypothetical protein
MSKNWLIENSRYHLNPTLENYLIFLHAHFKFCSKRDSAISAEIYIESLEIETRNKLQKIKSTNKEVLILSALQRILVGKESRNALREFLKNDSANKVDLQHILPKNHSVSNTNSPNKPDITNHIASRTYLIAVNIYLELNNRESEYGAIVRDTKSLQEFINHLFGPPKLSPRITTMKNFSYKKILEGKNNEGAKGQLKPQLKQIVEHPDIFGEKISAYASSLLTEYFDNIP